MNDSDTTRNVVFSDSFTDDDKAGATKSSDLQVDLFYKTCKKDEEWLNYSLRSVNKFARGFRQIVIVTDKGHDYKPVGDLPVKLIALDLPPDHPQYAHGIGYWWQMGIKMSWDHFTDADAVVSIDSDCIFYDYVSPNSWQQDGKVIWMRRPWSEVGNGIVWKKGTDYFLGKETKYSHMVFPGFYITRNALKEYKSFMFSRFHQTPLSYFIDLRHPYEPEEYESMGAYLDEINYYEYCFCHPEELGNKRWPIKQFWSWGGLNEEIRKTIEDILK